MGGDSKSEEILKPVSFAEIPYGFQWGAAKVTRVASDERRGWAVLSVKTPKQELQLYVTKTGKIRVHDPDGEWFRLGVG